MAITDLQNRTAQLENTTQQTSSSDPMNKKKEILESRAIQNLGNLKDAKENRTWNQRLNNAFDQARPQHARKIMNWLESVRENDINEIKEESVFESPVEWVTEFYEAKKSTKHAGITKEQLNEMNRDLWAVLVDKCGPEVSVHFIQLFFGYSNVFRGLICFVEFYHPFGGRLEDRFLLDLVDVVFSD